MRLIVCLLIGIAAAVAIELIQWGLARMSERILHEENE